MKIRVHASTRLNSVDGYQPGEPLWRVAPTRDEEGRRLADFMMLIPHLKEKSAGEVERTSGYIRSVLALHSEVVFADLNLALNVLWVSLRPKHGVISEIVAAIRQRVPEAVLVAHHSQPHY